MRLEVNVGAGDVAGIGWERSGDATNNGQTPKGMDFHQTMTHFWDSKFFFKSGKIGCMLSVTLKSNMENYCSIH